MAINHPLAARERQLQTHQRVRSAAAAGFHPQPLQNGDSTAFRKRCGKSRVAGFFQTLSTASEGHDFLPLADLEPDARCTVATRPQLLQIKRFGGLIKHILPVPLNPAGFILRTVNKFYRHPGLR